MTIDIASLRLRLRELVEADPRGIGGVARAAGLSPSYLSQILTGRRPNPSVETVGKVLAALGRSWRDLDADRRPGRRSSKMRV